MLVGTYDSFLVAASLLVAILASYTALDMVGRVVLVQRAMRWCWLLGGACAMGLGIWSMHFIGMLAFDLPIALAYDTEITVLSLLAAVLTSLFALWLVTRPTLPHLRLAAGAVLMGFGIAAMHYIGMAALQMIPGIDYHPGWLALSIVVAITASWSALWIAFRLRLSTHRPYRRLAAAVVMGLAIVGMHYTGMAAARFPEGSICGAAQALGTSGHMGVQSLALLVTGVTVSILGVVLLLSLLDGRRESELLRLHTTALAASLDTAHAELSHAALHDPLTRLPNRKLLLQRLEHAIADAERSNSRFALMFMALDDFKRINHTHGYHFGDALLVAVTACIRRRLRSRDTLARMGGDEFVLIVRLDAEEDAATLAERIFHTVSKDVWMVGKPFPMSVSLGVACCPDHGMSAQTLLAHADVTMGRALADGGNAMMVYATWMEEPPVNMFQLRGDLREALTHPQQLDLYYQPRLSVASQRVCGAEALLRWRHPHIGMVPPSRFLGLAERSGLIQPLGRWVLDNACRQLTAWQLAGRSDWTVSVNLSQAQFESPELISDVADALQRHGITPGRLILEVSETALVRDPRVSAQHLHALAALGVGVSIDGFGAGPSVLPWLNRLPVTEIKLDPRLLRDIGGHSSDVVVLSALLALAHALHLDIVATGIENSEQRQAVERLGCDFLQGFALGHAVDAERFLHLYAQQMPTIDLRNSRRRDASGSDGPPA